VFSAGVWAAIWLTMIVAAQGLETWISAPLRIGPDFVPSKARRRAQTAAVFFNSLFYCSISVPVWLNGGDLGKVFAMITPAGAILHASLQDFRVRRLKISACHAVYLIGTPIICTLIQPGDKPIEVALISLCGVLFVAHVVLAVRRIEASADALRAARDVAQEANAAKSDFLATISHEIRTPLNGVVAGAALLGRTPLSPEQAEHVAMLSNSSEVLMGLLNDVLDISKIESGKLEFEVAPFDVRDKLEASVALWRSRADAKSVSLRLIAEDLPARILTDPLRFQQIVFNLLSNAVKFTDQGCIDLRAGHTPDGRGGGSLWIEVDDTGCGMDQTTAEKVFDSFIQANAGTTRQHGGTGLGLSISRRLAELMGGSLSVISAPGRGSCFRFEAPMIEAPIAAGPVEAMAALPSELGGAVLLAEDHEVNQRIVRLILEPIGFSVTVVENGADAVAVATQQTFDAILLDMQMPVMGGVEAAIRIRAGGGPNARTPLIALTANALDEHRAQWAAAGVKRFISKPVDIDGLVRVVSSAIADGRAAEDMAVAG
jgi:signal transduction histidine kinase/CheY-like chemotaxis protein